jgi:hypothetical protein
VKVWQVPLLRVVRSREAWTAAIGWSAVVLGSALLGRHYAAPHPVDHALDVYATFGVPFIAYALVAVATAHESLGRSGRALVVLGAEPASVARSTVVASMVASATVVGVLGAVVVLCAHGQGDPPLSRDALDTLAYGGLAAMAYAAYFMVGAALASGFWCRALLLAVDWVLGSDDGFGAVLTPRGHLRSLLGGEAPFDALPWQSLLALATMAALFATLAVRRGARRR